MQDCTKNNTDQFEAFMGATAAKHETVEEREEAIAFVVARFSVHTYDRKVITSLEEFWALPPGDCFELVDGRAIPVSPKSFIHFWEQLIA